jgi:hypothetical protein
MLRKSLIGAVAVLGLVVAGSVAGSQPASAGYSYCGYWNGYCRSYFIYPGWSYGWYGHKGHHWKKSYSHRNWNKGNANKNYHAYKGRKGKHYR